MNSPVSFAISLVLALAGACGGADSQGDAGVDASTTSFDQPVGAACDAATSALCASGAAACHGGLCTAFCSAVTVPRCPSSTTELHDTGDDRALCLCVSG